MANPSQTLAQIAAHLRRPRAMSDVYHDYNALRQKYILDAAARHFKVRDDDPAPLYGKTLLDAGCGASTIAEFLALSGAEITAVDANAAALEKAKESAEAFGAPVTFLHTRVEDLINGAQKFDIILALDLLEDTAEPGKMLWVLRQLLAPGGLIVFGGINRTFKAWFYHIVVSGYLYNRTPPGSRSIFRFHTPVQLAQMCRAAGLRLAHVQGLRLSFSKERWKLSSQPHTRYLAMATLAGGAAEAGQSKAQSKAPSKAEPKAQTRAQSKAQKGA